MEILDKFGIDPVLLVAQFINFGIILFVLRKFLYKPVMTMLKTRRDEIKKGITDAEKAAKLLEEAAEKEKKLLRNAQAEVKKLLDEAKKSASGIIEESKGEARKETEKMLKEAKTQIVFESNQAEKRLVEHISKLAIAMLSKSIPDIVTDNEKTTIIKEATKKLKGKVN